MSRGPWINKAQPTTPAKPPASVSPVRQQVKELSGFSTQTDLKDALPDSTATPTTTKPEAVRKPRAPKTVEGIDPRYDAAIAGMTSLGGSRAIKTVFKSAAIITEKKEMELNQDEAKLWDDYFYVVGKKSNFDPTRPWYLVLYAGVLLAEHILTRLWKLNSNSFANSIGKLFGMEMEDGEKSPLGTGVAQAEEGDED